MQVQKLENARTGEEVFDDAESKNGEIKPGADRWSTTMDKLNKQAKRLLHEVKANKGSKNGWCPNLKSRYSLSRKAKKMTQYEAEVGGGLGDFSGVSYHAAPVGTKFTSTSTSTGGSEGFESRRSIMNEVMEALTDDTINMIGICGMVGVGKTTIVKEVGKEARDKKLFNKVVLVGVSQKPDLIQIQGAIAEQLGFGSIGGNNLLARANKLRERILSTKRVLVILDDVWERLTLNEIGIPFGDDHKGCKIVLTSRSEDVCNHMGTQKKIIVQVLPEEEAWNLFKEMAEISDDDERSSHHLQSTQKAVAKKCGGLPIAIVIVGKALRVNGTDAHLWDYSLELVQKSICKNFIGVDAQVFRPLELSYNYLESEEAKKCFLLCSLYPEDSSIPIEELVRYAIALELLHGVTTVGEARKRVHEIVDELKKWYLLMVNKRDECVKMNVVVRDVAKSIASSNEHSFMVTLEDWPEKDQHLKNYTAISLRSTGVCHLPNNFELPNLQLLQLEYHYELPDWFFQGMKELKVVALSYKDVQSLPTSLRCLTNLRSLSLYHFTLGDVDISVIGALKNLEILSITGSSMEELPKEIGNLTRLRLLYMLECRVYRISPEILLSLSSLEELYVGDKVISWRSPSISLLGTKERASITGSLSNLVALDIHVQFFWPRDLDFGNNFKKFNITIGRGEHKKYPNPYQLQKRLELCNLNASYLIESGLKMLLKSTQILELFDVVGLQNILFDLDKDGFKYLTNLSIAHSRDLEYLIYTSSNGVGVGVKVPQTAFPVLEWLNLRNLHNLKGIIYCHDRDRGQPLRKSMVEDTQLGWLQNLRFIQMEKCDKLESVFSLSMARLLVQLQTIDIYECNMMETVVSISSEEVGEDEILTATNEIKFPKLKELFLRNLPILTAFCKGVNAIELPQLNNLKLFDMPNLVSLCLPDSRSNYDDTIIQPQLFDIKIAFFCLKKLHLSNCSSFRNLFSYSSASHLVDLRELTINKCSTMEVVVEDENEDNGEGRKGTTLFPKLKHLELNDLPKLRCFCHIARDWELPLVKSVTVIKCPKMETFSPGVIRIPSIEVVWVTRWALDEVEGLWADDLNDIIKRLIKEKQEVQP